MVSNRKIVMLVLATVASLSALGPWASAGIFSVAGTDGDGVITLILFGICATVVATSIWGKTKDRTAGVIGVIAGGLGSAVHVYDWADIQSLGGNQFIEVSVGGGLVIGTLTGIVFTLLALMAAFKPSAIDTSATEVPDAAVSSESERDA